MSAEETAAGTGGDGREAVARKNKEAVQVLASIFRNIVAQASAVGLSSDSFTFSQMPVFLPMVTSDAYSAAARGEATEIVVQMLARDAHGIKVLIQNHEGHLAATCVVLRALLSRNKPFAGMTSRNAAALKSGMMELRALTLGVIATLEGQIADSNKERDNNSKGGKQSAADSAALAHMCSKKLQKKQAKIDEYRQLLQALDLEGGGDRALLRSCLAVFGTCLSFSMLALVGLVHVALSDASCRQGIEPYLDDLARKGPGEFVRDGLGSGKEEALLGVVEVCKAGAAVGLWSYASLAKEHGQMGLEFAGRCLDVWWPGALEAITGVYRQVETHVRTVLA